MIGRNVRKIVEERFSDTTLLLEDACPPTRLCFFEDRQITVIEEDELSGPITPNEVPRPDIGDPDDIFNIQDLLLDETD